MVRACTRDSGPQEKSVNIWAQEMFSIGICSGEHFWGDKNKCLGVREREQGSRAVEPERFIEAPTLGPNVTARATPSVTAPPARPGQIPPFWGVERPGRAHTKAPYKAQFTTENVKGAKPPRAAQTVAALDGGVRNEEGAVVERRPADRGVGVRPRCRFSNRAP